MPKKKRKKQGMAKRTTIPDDIKRRVKEIVAQFNKGSGRADCYYEARFQGKYLYLDRCDYGNMGPICRLTYTSSMTDWEFAIFKWSREQYDPGEWMFPGSGLVDGTVAGAMKAGLEAYPV